VEKIKFELLDSRVSVKDFLKIHLSLKMAVISLWLAFLMPFLSLVLQICLVLIGLKLKITNRLQNSNSLYREENLLTLVFRRNFHF